MGFLIIAVICVILIILLWIIFGVNVKQLKGMTNIQELDDIAEKYPNNIDICKEYLKKLKNEKVKIQEDANSDATVYIATSDKICIGNMRNSYARIQTIAHECLHSIQNRKLLLFNFIFSNIYLLYFAVILICALFGKLPYKMTFLAVLCILGLVYYAVRIYLENDAMIKARFLAKEYMEKKGISTREEIESMVTQYDKVNDLGIKCVNYQLFAGILVKVLILALICWVR